MPSLAANGEDELVRWYILTLSLERQQMPSHVVMRPQSPVRAPWAWDYCSCFRS